MSKLKILAVSDVESKFIWDYFDPKAFRGIDLIISCGDLKPEYLSFLVTMIPAPLLYVHGNHDKNYKIKPPLGCQCIDGCLVNFDGIRILGMGGCKSPRNAEHEYSDAQMWRRLKKLTPEIRRAGGVDILVSHAPAAGLGDLNDQFHQGFEALRYVDENYCPQLHLYGHVHLGGNPIARQGVMEFGDTTLVNATGYRIVEIKR